MELINARDAHRESLKVIRENLPASTIEALEKRVRAAITDGKTSVTVLESELIDRVSPKTMRAIEAYVKACGYAVVVHYGCAGLDLSWA